RPEVGAPSVESVSEADDLVDTWGRGSRLPLQLLNSRRARRDQFDPDRDSYRGREALNLRGIVSRLLQWGANNLIPVLQYSWQAAKRLARQAPAVTLACATAVDAALLGANTAAPSRMACPGEPTSESSRP